jgi:hypothetical protein
VSRQLRRQWWDGTPFWHSARALMMFAVVVLFFVALTFAVSMLVLTRTT